MKALGPADIKAKALKLWDGQRLLRAWLEGEALFPLEIPLKTPSGPELAEHFGEVRAWIAALKAEAKPVKGHGYQLVERQVLHRQLGMQHLPVQAVLPSWEDAVRLAGKWQAFQRWQALVRDTRLALPALEPFMRARPLALLEHAEAWPRLLKVVAHLAGRPRPGCYLRELDVAGLDTKFIEAHEALLWEMLVHVMPPEGQDPTVTGRAAHGFARRFGLRHDPPLVRFRALDPALAPCGFADVSVPVEAFAAWAATGVRTVFVTENKVNGLTFPAVPGAIVVFGLGYGVAMLGEVPWLASRELVYWGDLDTHGFAMLARLRGRWPHVTSVMMDEATLLAHGSAWGQEALHQRCLEDLPALTAAERDVYDGLRQDRWAERLRLEQERLAFGHVERCLRGWGC